ncbi:hypothetical protein DBR43_00545 [Pedobacter sp. KBW06]|uniref:hypothetical protein n=1 Tax=Pedobacter sp. KBW06 TaxID=2153359 RepID=UPI000F5A6CA0|nr:hypothetical protein [Pedobacter sp. KBW06]RQO73930.1 hypothetical protein DBR43_00545 [Pedobacter sp. KBW06]
MKKVNFVFLFVMCFGLGLQAQVVRSYIAIVKTKDGKKKGILYQVTEDALTLQQGDSLILVKGADIKSIRIRASKTPYDIKTPFKYDPFSDRNYETLPNSQVRVRKDREKEPDFGDQVAGEVGVAAVNLAVNIIAAPIQAINSSIIKMDINQNPENFKNNKEDLSYHSIYYQRHSNVKDELKKIKAISNAMKAQ